MLIARRHGAELRLASPLRRLLVEGGRVTGVVLEREETEQEVRAASGVVLAAGGFARNADFRRRHQPVGSDWTTTVGADTGDAILAAMELGAGTALLDAAWWVPAFAMPGGGMGICLWERSLPGSIIVDERGERFANESESYVDFVQTQLDRKAVPAWLILDGRHRRRYLFATMLPGLTPKSMLESGFFVRADTLDELARQTGIDAAGLRATVERFNRFAAAGVDEDFARGQSIYDNYYGDRTVKPNPNLGPIDQSPFWATKIYPGDLGTKGGLLTDEHARVLRDDGSPIDGLYAAGNTTATVMGRTYPGPGGTIGPGMVFGYLAALHIAGMPPASGEPDPGS
jgi:3-oxosteroid 1-dehydrogenase